eukprot:PhF_6_TR6947/c0_g1_i1/m.10199
MFAYLIVIIPIVLFVFVILWYRSRRGVVLPLLPEYDIIIIGGTQPGLAAAQTAANTNDKLKILVLEKQTGGNSLADGWNIYTRPNEAEMRGWGKSFPSWSWAETIEPALQSVESLWPCVKIPKIVTDLSPLTWASGLAPACRLPMLEMIYDLPTNVEYREGIQVINLNLSQSELKCIGRGYGSKHVITLKATKGIILCCGKTGLKDWVLPANPSWADFQPKDVIALPMTYQAKPKLRTKQCNTIICEAMQINTENDINTTVRFVPHSHLCGNAFEHGFSIVTTISRAKGKEVDDLIAYAREARQLVTQTNLQHLTTHKEFIDIHSLQSVNQKLAQVVLYEPPSVVRRRVGVSSQAVALLKKIQEEVQTDEYLRRYCARYKMLGGEPYGMCPMGVVVDEDCRVVVEGTPTNVFFRGFRRVSGGFLVVRIDGVIHGDCG